MLDSEIFVNKQLLEEADRLFVPIIGIMLLFAKIALRRIARRLASLEFDGREALAWFGVDLSVLNLSAWIGVGIPQRLKFNSHQTTLVYATLILFVVITTCVYKRYLRLAASPKLELMDQVGLYTHILVVLTFGFAGLIATASTL